MKRLFLLLLCVPGGCGSGGGESGNLFAEGAEPLPCAVDGAPRLEPVCALERVSSPDGLTLTIRSPSGSFRRLLVTRDGRGVIAADGADKAIVTPLAPDRIEVTIGGDRYRLPATVRQ